MSKCEQFTQVTQNKWATVSKLLRSLMTNEWMWAIHSGRSGKKSKLLILSLLLSKNEWFAQKKYEKSCFLYVFYSFFEVFYKKNQKNCSFLLSEVSKSLRLLTKNEQMSESLTFLRKSLIHFFYNKQVICSEIPNPGVEQAGEHWGGSRARRGAGSSQ